MSRWLLLGLGVIAGCAVTLVERRLRSTSTARQVVDLRSLDALGDRRRAQHGRTEDEVALTEAERLVEIALQRAGALVHAPSLRRAEELQARVVSLRGQADAEGSLLQARALAREAYDLAVELRAISEAAIPEGCPGD